MSIAGSIIYFASRMAARSNPTKYPIGKARLEPLAIIVFASMMGVASLQVGVDGSAQMQHAGTMSADLSSMEDMEGGCRCLV